MGSGAKQPGSSPSSISKSLCYLCQISCASILPSLKWDENDTDIKWVSMRQNVEIFVPFSRNVSFIISHLHYLFAWMINVGKFINVFLKEENNNNILSYVPKSQLSLLFLLVYLQLVNLSKGRAYRQEVSLYNRGSVLMWESCHNSSEG